MWQSARDRRDLDTRLSHLIACRRWWHVRPHFLTAPTDMPILVTGVEPLDGEPPSCTCHLSGGEHPDLVAVLALETPDSGASCLRQLASIDEARESELDELACVVTDRAMRWRCRGAPESYRLWRDATNQHDPLTGSRRDKVAPFITTICGTRAKPKPASHVCGWVAEFVWYELTVGRPERVAGHLRRVEGPSFHATEPGGDGLAVWQRSLDDELTFCLWEIKNHLGHTPRRAITRAYGQIGARGLEYLAKLTAVEAARSDDAAMSALYASLVDLWAQRSDRRGAGVAIATHHRNAGTTYFDDMPEKFPEFDHEWQLEGLVAAIGDFETFTFDVRERMWIAL